MHKTTSTNEYQPRPSRMMSEKAQDALSIASPHVPSAYGHPPLPSTSAPGRILGRAALQRPRPSPNHTQTTPVVDLPALPFASTFYTAPPAPYPPIAWHSGTSGAAAYLEYFGSEFYIDFVKV